MRASINVVLALFAAGGFLASAASVVDLDSDNFEAFMNSHEVVMTEFYAPWCGVCKELEPLYEETASVVDADKDIKFARVDCVAEPELCENYRVRIFPTIYVFKGFEKREIYNGKRLLEPMITFAEKRYQPPVSHLTTSTIEDFKTVEIAVVIGYFAADDQNSNQTFTKVAESLLDDFAFGATTDIAQAKADGVEVPAVILYKQYDDNKLIYDGAFKEEAIKLFINKASLPLIGDLAEFSNKELNGRSLACIFAETDAELDRLAEEVKSIAERTKDSIRWVTADAKISAKFASKMHLKDGKWPALGIVNLTDNYPFNQDEAITTNSVSRFVNDFLDKKIAPHVLSEPIPVQDGPLTVVVRDTFKEIVLDSSADVLLEFYAPWCGHCKKLAPEYERLARIYHEHGNKVVIAKIDATANEIPDHPVTSFPTIKLFPGNTKDSPLQYKGNRSIEDLALFVRDNGVSGVDILEALKTTSEDHAEAVKDTASPVVDARTENNRDEL